ncbi:MAG: RelA/SpoT family protein [Saprospiraceae bacterium]|nr:bifunctional (p)ppGpp synthetase/guanosine-3',5'-bis(diphosphate) 3'-pyrophosphohydrolase [Saprospiraceae bacterium]MCB9343595.1 bifunctional (p)ppGpp synthetase/guanosine-3',5'-bis(diphosphate) 3'-pyrophosphohydrolase [Lewinellaceae bacterium]
MIATADNLKKKPELTDQEAERQLILQAYRDLLHCFRNPLNEEDKKNLRAAFDLAVEAHQEQRRKSGEPYILHPIEVARICVEEIGLGPTAAVSALLHDVVEDTEVTLKDIHEQFGDRVALIVDGLTKLDGLHETESPQAENLGKVLRTMLSDVRVVLIKMADRLHNMRTIKSMPEHKQKKIAAETSFIYAPVAHRLGLHKIKTELDDICFKIEHPDEYKDIARKLEEKLKIRGEYINKFIERLHEIFKDLDFPYRVMGRPKSIYSIWRKINTKNVSFENIYDLFAVRVIIDVPKELEKRRAWDVYSYITDHFQPITERLRDWITSPKSNGYESLQTTVLGLDNKFVEIQIRSERMHEIAERGFAAHWKYKAGKKGDPDVYEKWLNRVRETIESSSGNAIELLADIRSELFTEEVHVFTPRGEMKSLPDGATALDFAFSIHSDIGSTCRAVKINNRVCPIHVKLHDGDQVEIITDKNQKPSEDWLQHVVTSRAKNRIRSALKEEKRIQADYGREILERKLNSLRVSFDENCDMLVKWYGYHNRLEFLSAIHLEQVELKKINRFFKADGTQLIEKDSIKTKVVPETTGPTPIQIAKPKGDQKPEIIINDEPGSYYQYSFANCCNPVQGDKIFAFVLVQGGVKIHRSDCPNANNLLAQYGHRVLRATWGNISKNSFLTKIVVTGIDTGPGVIQQLTNRIYDLGINIRSFEISGEGGYFVGHLGLIVVNTNQLQHAILELRKFDWVSNVKRED